MIFRVQDPESGTSGFSVYSRILEQKQTESSFHFVCLHSTVEGHQGEGESHMMWLHQVEFRLFTDFNIGFHGDIQMWNIKVTKFINLKSGLHKYTKYTKVRSKKLQQFL